MSKGIVICILVVAVVAIGGYFLLSSGPTEEDAGVATFGDNVEPESIDQDIEDPLQEKDDSQPEVQPESSPTSTPTPAPTPEPTPALTPEPTPTPEPILEPSPTPTPPPEPTPEPEPTPAPTPEPPSGGNTIVYTSSGYSPSVLTVSVGTNVTFENQAAASMWPATYSHPTHKIYPGSNINKCGSSEANTIFDACAGIQNGGEWSFVFTQQGTWEYHDHLKPGRTGTIIVE